VAAGLAASWLAGWQWLFLVKLPTAIFSLVMLKMLPDSRRSDLADCGKKAWLEAAKADAKATGHSAGWRGAA